MSEPFPSKAYQELCITHRKELWEEWKPKVGDYAIWCRREDPEDCPHIIVEAFAGPQYLFLYIDEAFWDKTSRLAWKRGETLRLGYAMYPLAYCAWLPRLAQLIEMLEERGYGLYHLGDERFHPDFDGRDWNPDEPYQALAQGKEPGDYVKGIGPDPETAMLRAWLEVVGENE